jgi:hypothetical protein
MSDNFENAIFDFGKLEGTEAYTLDDELTISILKGDTGDKIGRLTLEEQPHYDSIVYYPGFNKIQKSLNNYMFMKGSLKVCYEWTDDEGITQETINKFWELASHNPDDSYAVKFTESNKLGYTIGYGGHVTQWSDRSSAWEIATNKAYLEALEDNTIVICALGTSYGWNYKNIDLAPQQRVSFNKEGEKCYILVGDRCEITVSNPANITYDFYPYDCKKLTSSECFIKNIGEETTRVIAIYK